MYQEIKGYGLGLKSLELKYPATFSRTDGLSALSIQIVTGGIVKFSASTVLLTKVFELLINFP